MSAPPPPYPGTDAAYPPPPPGPGYPPDPKMGGPGNISNFWGVFVTTLWEHCFMCQIFADYYLL